MTPDVAQITTMMENTTVESSVMEQNQSASQVSSTPDAPIADGPATKLPMHQRLFQRISRAGSFTGSTSGRERSSSAPYRSSSGPSCISLATSVTPSTSTSNGLSSSATATDSSLASSRPDSPSTTPFPDFPHALEQSQSSNAIRKVDLTTLPDGPSTSSLPAALVRQSSRPQRQFKGLWEGLPEELKLKVLSFLLPKDLIRASATSRGFHKACLDGQLWPTISSLELNNKMAIASMQSLMAKSGPFMKHLSLRGYRLTQAMGPSTIERSNCTNLESLALEGSDMSRTQLKMLLQTNKWLLSLDLKGLNCVDDEMCNTIAECCPKITVLDLSWCKNITPRGVTSILDKCRHLRDIRLAEMPQFEQNSRALAVALHNVRFLQRLDLSYCNDITNESVAIIMHGVDPPRDVFTGMPLVRLHHLRHLDISHCPNLTDGAIEVIGQCTTLLESLIATGLNVTPIGFRYVLASAEYLKTLDLDDIEGMDDNLLVHGIPINEMAQSLKHLSVSSCEHITDAGVIAVLKACPNLQTLRVDGTEITDETLYVAAEVIRERASIRCSKTNNYAHPAHVGLAMDVFDCSGVSASGIERIMMANNMANDPNSKADPEYSTPIIQLKCFYGWQQVVQLHTARVMSGSGGLADRLAKSWFAYMEDPYLDPHYEGESIRRRLRARRERIATLEQFNRARALAEANREDDVGVLATRLRSRTIECAIM